MTLNDLTETEFKVYDYLSATTEEIATHIGCSNGVVYDHISNIRNKIHPEYGINNTGGEYQIVAFDGTSTDQNTDYNQNARANNVAKQTITKKANKFFASIEGWKDRVNKYPEANGEIEHNEKDGHVDVTWHITDVHFGDYIEKGGEAIYSSEIAEARVTGGLLKLIDYCDRLEEAGYTVDNINLLPGGDICTNEAIYKSQPHDIDENILEQIMRSVSTFDWVIDQLSQHFPSIQVVCQHGNHGEFRVDGSSGQANADDFVYAFLDYMIRKDAARGVRDNVKFMHDEQEYYINFEIRGHNAHLRHGQNTRGHVGTSSQSDLWGSWADEHDYEIAFYGHHHQYKNEHYNGRRIFMGGTPGPPSEYAESIGEFGEPVGYFVVTSDENPVEDVHLIHYE